jgi:hypothetical protein
VLKDIDGVVRAIDQALEKVNGDPTRRAFP